MDDLKKELSNLKEIKDQLNDVYSKVNQGFIDQQTRDNDTIDFWDLYNCNLNHNQAYNDSLSRIYVPIVHDAVEARVTRFANQIFPQNGRFVEVVSHDGEYPDAHTALLENYVRNTKLRTEVIPAMLRNGDIEGQYSVYVSWRKSKRTVRFKTTEPITLGGDDIGDEDEDDLILPAMEVGEVDTIAEEEVDEGRPQIDVISDSDLLIYPVTADSVENALEIGGSVTIIMRLTEGKIESMIEQGVFTKAKGKELLTGFGKSGSNHGNSQTRKAEEEHGNAAGIRTKGNTKVAQVYQTWTKLKYKGKSRLSVVYYGGDNLVLSAKLNPYWCDKCPIISVPVRKLSGICKGVSMVKPAAELQYMANDAANLGMSSGIFSLQPIIMTDPEKNPRISSMVMNVGAIWQTNPNDTQVVEFPKLYQDGFQMIDWCTSQIFRSLGVNPSMVTSGSAYRKPTQAEVANEQMVDVLTTADAVTIIEEGILTPMMERYYDYDAQFRTEDATVRAFGSMGLRASMEVITPSQENNRYTFRWFGVEQARTAQRIQQQISAINVIRGIPPQLLPGRKLDMVPFVESLAENAFGPRLAPLIFKDERAMLSVDVEVENQMLLNGFEVDVNPLDDDVAHLRAHLDILDQDASGFNKLHIAKHQAQLKQKQQEVSMGMAQANPSGAPGGGAAIPQSGSSPAGPSNMKQPAGAVHQDSMDDPTVMPRNM